MVPIYPAYQDNAGKPVCYEGDLLCYESQRDDLNVLRKPKYVVQRFWRSPRSYLDESTSGNVWMEFMKIESVLYPSTSAYFWDRPLYAEENEIVIDLWNTRSFVI